MASCRAVVILYVGILLCYGHVASIEYTTSGDNVKSSHSGSNERGMASLSNAALLRIMAKYGHNGSLNFEGFEHLLESLGLGNIAIVGHNITSHQIAEGSWVILHTDHDHSESENHHHVSHGSAAQLLWNGDGDKVKHHDNNSSGLSAESLSSVCLDADDFLSLIEFSQKQSISPSNFLNMCPALILQLDSHICTAHRRGQHATHDHDTDHHHDHHHHHDDHHDDHGDEEELPKWRSASVWGFSVLACVIISAVGLLAVAIIPVMHKVIYNHMLQFLVALAIGSLTGDALLHLLPHALAEHSHHDHHGAAHDHRAVWFGLTSLGGIYMFFVVERVVGLCSERKRTQNEHRVKMKKLNETDTSVTNESLLGDGPKASSSQQPIVVASSLPRHLSDAKNVDKRLSRHGDAATSCEEILMTVHTNKDVRKFADDAHDEVHQHCDPKMKADTWGDHSNSGHNHSHNVPGSVASVAWMVIVGDGFHNFADGLAIGSAFASSLTGGLSTSIAVFCHELPHELGDFAMLLNAGMSAKQALVYNCVSSLLCMVGMVFGVAVGNITSATSWIFALIAGLFLYVALVDMLPEMTSVGPKKGEHPLLHLALQNSGMLVGASVMLLIALFEDRLQAAFSGAETSQGDDSLRNALTTSLP